MRRYWVVLWAVSALCLLLLTMVASEPIVTLYAEDGRVLLWVPFFCAVLIGGCMAFGWQRREFPTQIIAWLVILFIIGAVIPGSWGAVRQPFLTVLIAETGWVVFIGWIGVIVLASYWAGWRLRKFRENERRRNHIIEISRLQLTEGIALLDRRENILWANQPARLWLPRIQADVTRMLQRARENKRMQTQTFAMGEGERISVQITPHEHWQSVVVIKPLQNYADATQFYEHFIRRLVHDMRNPLAAIIAHASNLQTYQLPDGNPYQKTISTIETEAQRLTRLVDSMLFDARLSYVPLAVQRVDLRDVVEDVLYQQDERAIREGKTLEVEMPPIPTFTDIDRDLLTRAVSNVVDNSLKYSQAGCRVVISLVDWVGGYRISVSDTGDGIPVDMLPERIFEPLVRGKTGQGSGLGLAIVKKIVEMHAGTIQAETSPEGSVIRIWLPA